MSVGNGMGHYKSTDSFAFRTITENVSGSWASTSLVHLAFEWAVLGVLMPPRPRPLLLRPPVPGEPVILAPKLGDRFVGPFGRLTVARCNE